MSASASRSVSPVVTWFNEWWIRVPEPRFINLLFGACYLIAVIDGAMLITSPADLHVVNDGTLLLVGWFMVLGGFLSMVTGTMEIWKLERVGIASILAGLLSYGSLILHFDQLSIGVKATELGIITFACALFVVRLAMIWGYTYRPRG